MQVLMKLLPCMLAAALLAATPTTSSANDGPQAVSEHASGAAGRARVERVMAVDAVAVPVNSPIVLDGRFNEEIWQQAPPVADFQQREPAEGQPPTMRTEARMAYDGQALYVAVRAFDSDPDKLVGILTRRDQRSPSDWIRIVIDSYFDKRSAYEFGVNPVGVKTDRYYFNDGQSDDSWDAVWDVEVERDSDGWRAEFKIPFSQLRFNTLAGGPVGFAVIREVGRLAETVSWPLLSRNANGFVSQFGEMRGLQMTGAPKRLELLPYTVADLRTQPDDAANPLSNPSDPGAALGVDMKYAVTPGLTLTATANPDFGQVEADPAVVNLDAFETFFPERRPFFVEGSGTFRFNMDCNDGNCTGMFYSRRIGRSPQGSPELVDGEYSKQPDTATIIGAAKLTGRLGGFSLGALTAVTAREDAEIASSAPGRRQLTVEPMTGYTVIRARKEFANQSSLGFMTTSTNRQNDASTTFLANNAFAGGIDYDWRLSPMYSVTGYAATSHLKGSTDAITRLQENTVHGFQRPDADYVSVDLDSTTLRGHAGSISIGKIAGETLRFSSFVGYKSPGFDTNDLGFMRRADERSQSNWIQWRNFRPGKYVRTRNFNINQYQTWNFGGDRLYSGGNVNSHWTFTNYYSVGGGYNVDATPFRDRVTRGGPGVLGNPSKFSLWYYANTDNRQALSFYYNGGHWLDTRNSARHDIMPGFNWRATSSMSLNIGLRYFINRDDAQWVENEDLADGTQRYVFGRIDQKTMSFNTRFNYTMTPDLSLQVYAEPFVSAATYSNYKELVDGRAEKYEDRYRPYAYSGNADFNIRSFRTTNVLRWEYKPGSALFLVWQQNKSDELEHGDFRFGRDFGGVFSAPTNNTFLIKFSYWLNM